MYESKQKQLRANGLKRVEIGCLAQRKCVLMCINLSLLFYCILKQNHDAIYAISIAPPLVLSFGDLSRGAKCIRHPLNRVLSCLDKHDRYTWYFTDPSLQITVARGHDKAPVFSAPVDQAIVCVSSLVLAREPFDARVFRNLHR